MLAIAMVLAALAALLHLGIFALEVFAWDTPRGRATFKMTPERARATAELAYNQGFYNLFLALVTGCGVVLTAADLAGAAAGAGPALVYAGAGSMTLAALVLVTRNRLMARAAAVQGALPALSVVLLTVALLAG
ncbi:DUF1304 domain-containing protein [Ruania suaedae]|uniref:DUF1304 domain-containing protein n=1 Tax=Ruania suaedae TaxID=2897774 RepID=UPI001E315D20|nr:DUF1304 domain-containing protein [Ruania suaedae]UFU03833.1 DUF1304 domain-containing protein [Ruania suaedae]